jgi:hypothetical protein
MTLTRDELVACLIKAGELEVSRRTIPASPTISRPFARRSTIDQFAEASSSPKVITSPAKRGSWGHLSVSSHNHRRALCLRTASASSGTY